MPATLTLHLLRTNTSVADFITLRTQKGKLHTIMQFPEKFLNVIKFIQKERSTYYMYNYGEDPDSV